MTIEVKVDAFQIGPIKNYTLSIHSDGVYVGEALLVIEDREIISNGVIKTKRICDLN